MDCAFNRSTEELAKSIKNIRGISPSKMAPRSNKSQELYLPAEAFVGQAQRGGRSSGGSSSESTRSGSSNSNDESSAFSSSETDEQEDYEERSSQSDLLIENSGRSGGSSAASSGRSSAECRDDNSADLYWTNPHCNLLPDLLETLSIVDTIRLAFLESMKRDQTEQLFDAADIDELRKPLPELQDKEQSLAFRLITRYITSKQLRTNERGELCPIAKKDIKSCAESLKTLLKFRNHYQLSRTRADTFCQEFYLLNGIFTFGHDKQNLPVLYIRARVHRKWSKGFDETFRRYVAWQVNCLTKSDSTSEVKKTIGNSGLEKDGSFSMCFDCLNVSYSCLDMDFLRFLVDLFVHHYPTYCRCAWLVDLPWLFRSVWKLVKSWLPEESKVQFITAKQLVSYIDEDQIPNSMKVNDLKGSEKPVSCRHVYPEDFESIRGVDELAQEFKADPSEVAQFKAHVEKICKEYEKLGA